MPCDSCEAALASDWLVFFYFQYGKNKKHIPDEGRQEGPAIEIISGGAHCTCGTPYTSRTSSTWCGGPPNPGEIESRRAEAEKLEGVGKSPGSSPTQQLAQMTAEARPSMLDREEPVRRKLWLTIRGKAPQKEFLNAGKVKKPQRYWPGKVALHEICQFQKSTDLLICKLPFLCLVCKIALEVGQYDMHFQVHTILTLQEAAEAYFVRPLEHANLCTIHVKCITIMSRIYN